MIEGQPVIDDRPGGGNLILLVPLLSTIVLAAGVLLIGGALADTGAIVMLAVVTALAILIFRQAARSDKEGPFLFQVLVLAWLAKLGFLVLRWYLLFNVYHGADTLAYNQAGQEIAATLAAGGSPDFHHPYS